MTVTVKTLLTAVCGFSVLLGWGRCELPKVPDTDITPPPLAVNSNGWRPLLPSPEKSTITPNSRVTSLQHPVLGKFQAHMVTAERTKRLQNAASSNKVEMYALAPPSILGSFSLFGHATLKSRDKKKNVAEHLIPPPVLQAESKQHFTYDRPPEVHRPSYYFQDPPKNKQFFPSEQIGEFPALYSTLGNAENFDPFYKTFSRTTTKFEEADVKLLPQSVGIHVTASTSFPQPGQVQDVPLHPSRLNAATGPQLSDHSYILPGSTPITSFEDQVYVTTWPPALPQQYLPKPSLRPTEKIRNTRPYFQDNNKSHLTSFRIEGEENPFVPTQNPSSQTYIRKPVFSEQATVPPTQINEVRLRKPLLPTPLTEDESEASKALYVFPDDQNEVRTHQSQKIQLPTSSPEEEKQSQVEVQVYQPRRPVSRRPALQPDTIRVRRPSYYQKQPVFEEVSLRKRRPVSRNNPPDDEQKQRKRLPTSEEVTIQPSETEPDDTPPTPVPLESSTFHSRKKVPLPDIARGKDRTRARTPRPLTTEKPITESPWSSDDYAYDPELQNTSHGFNEPHTVNEIIENEFMSTKSGSQHTATSSTSTTTTTTTTTITPPTTTSRSRLRFPSNITRPRFSLRDHKERLERLSALTRKSINETRPEESEANRSRNSSKGSIKQEEEPQRSRVRQRDPPRGRQRPFTSTSTSTETTVSTEPSTTSERLNKFKPTNNRHRPGANKYYSGYRTRTTEPATDSETSASSTTMRTVVKPKPLFSVTRKPYPLRTRPLRVTTSTTTTEQVPPAEESAISAGESEIFVTEASVLVTNEVALKATDNELLPVISEKADTTTTTDVEAGSPSTNPPSLEQDTMSPSQIVADLTSSANSGGYFSNRSNLRITMATEDPILPIEAFFPVRSSRDVLT